MDELETYDKSSNERHKNHEDNHINQTRERSQHPYLEKISTSIPNNIKKEENELRTNNLLVLGMANITL